MWTKQEPATLNRPAPELVRSILVINLLVLTLLPGAMQATRAQRTNRRQVIAAGALLDGKGHVLHNTRIVIEGSKIVAIDPKAGPVDYNLRGLTVMPGWIDAHVHLTWIFGKDRKNAGQGGTTPEATYAAASNAYVTLMA